MHTLRLKLKANVRQKNKLNKSFHIAYKIYVRLVKYVQKQLRLLSRNKRYKYLKHSYGIYKKAEDETKLNTITEELNLIVNSYKIYITDLENYVKEQQHKYKNFITSQQAQKIAKFVYKSVEEYLYGKGTKVCIKKYTDFNIISQKCATNGVKFYGSYILFLGEKIPVKYSNNKKDRAYVEESLNHNLKYCELEKIEFNSGTDFYVKLVLDGDAPSKIIKGTKDVGIDPGMSTMASVSDTDCTFEELAPKCKDYNKQIAKLQKQIDRSTRATNPNLYNEDGSVKKGSKKKFVYSKHCKHLKRKLRVLYRQKSDYTKCTHNALSNRILDGIKKVNIESINYQALAKRSKNTEKSDKAITVITKDGTTKEVFKNKKNKRFGKSITDRSPGLFIKVIEDKCKRYKIKCNKINTAKVKASQYNHITDDYEKHKLSERTKIIGTYKVQRDLYSAYIIKNVKNDKENLNKRKLNKGFNKFIELQDKEIKRHKEQHIKNKNFGF